MRKLYKHNTKGYYRFVLFDIYHDSAPYCDNGVCTEEERHYTMLDEMYKYRSTTTEDNLLKNYTLVKEPSSKQKQMLVIVQNNK